MDTVNNILGASNLSEKERSVLDYYGTNPECVRGLLAHESFNPNVWEPTAGHHNIVDVLLKSGKFQSVKASDIAEYPGVEHDISDFLNFNGSVNCDIIMNPPYYDAEKFVTKALDIVSPGNKVAVFLRLQFLEGQGRYERIFLTNPPLNVYVFPKRQVCSKTDDFTEPSAVAYCWIVWQKGYHSAPQIYWIEP